MKNQAFNSFGLLISSQLLLWYVVMHDNIATGSELLVQTMVISAFIGLFYGGYRWAKWVAAVLLIISALMTGTLTFEGYSIGFLLVALLYISIIFVMFSKKPVAEVTSEAVGSEGEVKPEPPPVVEGFYVNDQVFRYPLLVKRYQSLFIDAMILLTLMVIVMVTMGDSEYRQTVMVTLWILIALLYEPLLTVYSATIGQRVMGIRVRDVNNPNERIGLMQSYIRIIVKGLLGWMSFISINFNPKHRAIHDLAGSSVVIKVD